jgi:3-hydroxyacyl-CoA dehydrogenase/enoyl-CoA hydratase/3-hydroxybutyryl-CoA epimerase
MKQYQHLSLKKDADNIIWLGLDVAKQSANILNPEVINELLAACDEVKLQAPSGLIIYSAKRSGFIAGADVKGFIGISDRKIALQFIQLGHRLCDTIETLPFPTLAMINGFCLGGGLELSLACDYIIATDSSKLGLPEVKLGIHPGFGGSVRSIRRIGVLSAMPLMLTGRNVLGRKAAKLGLIDLCVPLRQLKNSARQIIKRAQQPAKQITSYKNNLLESALTRKLIANKMRTTVAQHAKAEHYPAPYALINLWEKYGCQNNTMFKAEAESVADLIQTNTAQNLIRVFFLQNRLKALGNKKLFTPRHIHIIGGGVMGGDIAAWCAMQGFRVTIQDMNIDALASVMQRANTSFKHRYKRDRQRIMQAQDNILPDSDGHGIAKADVIIEAIFENLEAKQTLFKAIEKKAKSNAILASNTSSIMLQEIAQVMQQPERLVGLHFFNPVAKMPLLEIIYTAEITDKEVLIHAQAFATHINKLPLPVLSSSGFLVNRILVPYLLEAVILHQEKIPAEIIDKAATDFGMPMGPLELADTVGLDICLHVGEILAETVGGSVPDTLAKDVKNGLLGKKSGKGFYSWKKGKPIKNSKLDWDGDAQQIQDRLINKLLNEAQKCLDEGLVEDADLLDAGTIFGTGFAPFRGGPMHYIASLK